MPETADIRFGADVINRIIESQKPGGQQKLQDAVIKETINPMINEMCKSTKFRKNSIYRMCVASNTTMNHLFAGINSDPFRIEPYIPTFFKTNSLFASDVGIEINKDAHIIMAPNIGSYVGGDITAGTLVSRSGTDRNFHCLSTLVQTESLYLVTQTL